MDSCTSWIEGGVDPEGYQTCKKCFIYKASNWKLCGMTTSSYYYVDSNGKEVHKKTLFNQAKRAGLKEREFAESSGLTRVYTPPKIKYSFQLK